MEIYQDKIEEIIKDIQNNSTNELSPAYKDAVNKLVEQILNTGNTKVKFDVVSAKDYFKSLGGQDHDDKKFLKVKIDSFDDNYIKLDDSFLPEPTFSSLEPIMSTGAKNYYMKTRQISTPTLISENQESKITMFPPCKYVTINGSLNVKSDSYHYANEIENYPICSHPSIANTESVTLCPYLANQAECDKYLNDSKVIRNTKVQNHISTTTYEYELVVSTSISFFDSVKCYSFKINNITNNSLVNELYYPCEVIDFENAQNEAIRIYDEYISAYAEPGSGYSIETLGEVALNTSSETVDEKVTTSFFDHMLSFA